MKKILVTGGNGFIGSHIVALLLENNYKVIILDSLINSSEKVIEKINNLLEKNNYEFKNNLRFFKGDVLDYKIIRNIFLEAINIGEPIDAVIHLAGLKSVEESIKNPIKYWNVNLNGTINLISVMIEFNCFKLIFSSSATIYANKDNNLINEDTLINPINPYGKTKAAVENLLNDLYKSSIQDWSIACLRFFNPIGAHESGLIGENSLNTPNNIFPIINRVGLGSIDEVKIFGSLNVG